MLPDFDVVTHIVHEVAAEEILPRFGRLKEHQIRSKSHPNDLVTDADIYAEQALSRRLLELLPGSVVVGEESYYQDKAILGRLSEDMPIWVLDPIDGTGNFVRGQTRFGVIVALMHGGSTIYGCIHDPVRNITVIGEKGGGTWFEGLRLLVPKAPSLPFMQGSITGIDAHKINSLVGRVGKIVHYASTAHDYLELLLGQIHFTFYNKNLLPWDHAAGLLLHKEANGYNALINGRIYQENILDSRGMLLAPDLTSWKSLLSVVD